MDPISLGVGGTAVASLLGGSAGAAGGAVAATGVGISAGTIGAVGTGASAAGGVLGAIGNLISGNASKKMYEYQAGISKMNERIAQQDASYARDIGESEAQQSGLKTRFTLGKIVSGQSGSGLDVNSGSNRDVQESQQAVDTHDESVIRSTAAKRAYGYEVEAAQASAQGEIYKMSGANAQLAGEIGAGSSILGAASSVSSKWLDAKRTGLF